MDIKRVRVVIVGAGLSGIAAARTLISGGLEDVLVLEASDRIGGRVWTVNHGNAVLELGAQWIHGDQGNPVYEMAEAAGLVMGECNLLSIGATEMTACPFKTITAQTISQSLVKDVNKCSAEIQDKAVAIGDGTDAHCLGSSLKAFWNEELSKCVPSQHDMQVNQKLKVGLSKWHENLICVLNACSSLDDLSLSSYGEYEIPGSKENSEWKNGCQSLLEHLLLPNLASYIKTGTVVTCLASPPESAVQNKLSAVTVHLKNSVLTLVADHVIVTPSLGFLKKHHESFFMPLLPEKKKAAIANLHFGTTNKIYLIFEQPFWSKDFKGINYVWLDEDILTEELEAIDAFALKGSRSQWWRSLLGMYVVLNQPCVLEGWLSGDGAVEMEAVPESEVMLVCCKLLECFMGAVVPTPLKLIRTAWSRADFIYGSYSSLPPNASGRDIDALAEPLCHNQIPRVLFAGEATCRKYYSTVHGAYMSGVREANRLLSYYGLPIKHQHPPLPSAKL